MIDNAKFWNKAARKYSRAPVRDMKSWDETLMRSRSFLKPSDHVLEIGAGTGSSALRMHDAVSHYRATDISSEMITIAKEKQQASNARNLEFAAATIFDEGSARYDAVLAYNVLHVVENVPAVIEAVARSLKPGGLFISKSACLSGKYALLRPFVLAMQLLGKAPTVAAFSLSQLESIMRGAGFEIVESAQIPQNSMMNFVVARKN